MNHNARRYSAISSPSVLKPRPRALTQNRSTSGKSRQGPVYVPERFEVVVPSSPDSLPSAVHLTESQYEEVPPARASRAINELAAAVSRVEAGLSRVVSMREQQAGFVACQLRLLEQLKEEHAVLSAELEANHEELQALDDEAAKYQEQNVFQSESTKRARTTWSQTFQHTLRSKRARVL